MYPWGRQINIWWTIQNLFRQTRRHYKPVHTLHTLRFVFLCGDVPQSPCDFRECFLVTQASLRDTTETFMVSMLGGWGKPLWCPCEQPTAQKKRQWGNSKNRFWCVRVCNGPSLLRAVCDFSIFPFVVFPLRIMRSVLFFCHPYVASMGYISLNWRGSVYGPLGPNFTISEVSFRIIVYKFKEYH